MEATAPSQYDPTSENEREVKLPSEPPIALAPNVTLQPPLTRRGYGPALVLVLPRVVDPVPIGDSTPTPSQIDPIPIQKWAEEGYAVLAYHAGDSGDESWDLAKVMSDGFAKAKEWADPDDYEVVADRLAMIGESCDRTSGR